MQIHAVSPLAPAAFGPLPTPGGIEALTARLGLYKHAREDLMVWHFPQGASVAGVFTTSSTASADVRWCRSAIGQGRARALVCNAGNSNAFTGPAGIAKNAATVAAVQALTGCAAHEVMLAATGVIGQPLPADRIAAPLAGLWPQLGAPDWERLARAFSTTDTYPKGAGRTAEIDGTQIAITGLAKGSGMIAPNMATMLSFVVTDAAIGPDLLQSILARQVELSFNAITVDGDTSTSDTLLVFATGASGMAPITSSQDPRALAFEAMLGEVLRDLALLVVRDGEGARKLVQIDVLGAVDNASAKRVALSIANSPLVKTAIAGGDANWGRVVMAVGKSGEPIDLDSLTIRFGGITTARGGAIAYDEAVVDAHFAGSDVRLEVELGVGQGQARVWTCDLTKGYIEINGDYRS